MIIKTKNWILQVSTIAWQGKNGWIYLEMFWENLLLEKKYAEKMFYELEDTNLEDFNNFYCVW